MCPTKSLLLQDRARAIDPGKKLELAVVGNAPNDQFKIAVKGRALAGGEHLRARVYGSGGHATTTAGRRILLQYAQATGKQDQTKHSEKNIEHHN